MGPSDPCNCPLIIFFTVCVTVFSGAKMLHAANGYGLYMVRNVEYDCQCKFQWQANLRFSNVTPYLFDDFPINSM